MSRRSIYELLSVGLCCIALGALLFTSVLRAAVGLESLQMIRAFNVDEHFATSMLLKNLERGDLDPRGFYNYGYAYISLAYWILRGLEQLDYRTSVFTAAYLLRLISLSSCVLMLWACYRTMRSLGIDRALAWIAVTALSSVATVSEYSTFIHPDLQQAALLALAGYWLCAGHSACSIVAAAACTGVAFGTKYSGIFFVPIVALAAVLRESALPLAADRVRVARVSALVLAVGVAFVLGWLLTNPHVRSHWSEFRQDLAFERAHVGRGHGHAEPDDPLLWFPSFAEDVTWAGVLALMIGALASAAFLVREWQARTGTLLQRCADFASDMRRRFLFLMLVFVFGSMAYLALEVNMRRMRYTLHFLPAVFVVSAFGLDTLLLATVRLRPPALLSLSALSAALALHAIREGSGRFNRYHDPRLAVGAWLDARYDSRTRIIADQYSYMPPRFRNVTVRTGIPRSQIEKKKPDVLVLTAQGTGRYCWLKPDTRFKDHQFACTDFDGVESYKSLFPWLWSGTSGYRLIGELPGFLVFADK